MIRLLAFCSCLAVIWGAAVPQTIGDQELIVGGRNTSISEVPYQVALLALNRFKCGGSILTPKYVLTAGHCLKPKKFRIQNFAVRAGSSIYDEGGVVVKVKTAVYHPKFSHFIHDYDVGILELSTPLNFTKDIQPIKLVTSPPPDGAMVKVSGWGQLHGDTLNLGQKCCPKQLQSVDIPIANKENCTNDYLGIIDITPRMICAGVKGKSPCYGDSGGPLTYNGRLAGIVSGGKSCGKDDVPEVFTNTADPDIRAFIKQYVPIDE